MLKVNKKVFEPLRKYDLVVHQGGSSSGKTYGILQYLFSVGAANPNEIITVVGQDIPNLKVGAYRDAQNILDDSEALRDWYPAELHNKSNRSFRCVNGSLVEFNSYSDEQDAKSGKRQRLFVNEANGVPYEVFEQLRMRTTKQVIIDFNPSAEFWAHKRLQEAHWVITSFRDNAFISPAVRERILSYEPTKENIERGIKKGTGELEGVNYEEASYEGYGPGGVAVLVDCLTDNKNRTVADIKHQFERHGGSLGEPGCVAWMFEKKGLIVLEKDKVDEEQLLSLALESGAEDVKEEDTEFEVVTDLSDFESVKKAIDDAGLPYTVAEISMIPKNTVKVEGKKAQQTLNLMEGLEDNEDVSHVYANFDISDEVLEALS